MVTKNMAENKKEIEKFDFSKIKCPVCGNPINKQWLDTGFSSNELICFVATCWTGKILEESSIHLFRIKVFNTPSIEIDYGELK